MTPAELMAWTKAVSRFAAKEEYKESRYAKDFVARAVLEIVLPCRSLCRTSAVGKTLLG